MSTDKEYLDRALDFSDDFDEEKNQTKEKSEKIEELIQEKPKKKDLKKYTGRTNVTSVQKKKKLDTDKAQKKLISISERNKQVLDILKNLDKKYTSESEYICKAIIEKYERDTLNQSKDLRESIKEILEEMVGDKFIIMKSSSDVTIPYTSPQKIEGKQENKEIDEVSEEDESADLIRGVLDMWDEE